MSEVATILIVDDDGDAALSLVRALKSVGVNHRLQIATEEESAIAAAQKDQPQVAVVDLVLTPSDGARSGFNLISKLAAIDPTCRIIVLTGHGNPEYGIKALSLGAASFLSKPPDVAHIKALINDGVQQANLRRSYQKLLEEKKGDFGLIGSSPPMQELKEQLRLAARTTQSVFLCGETGTGKGVCARLIHGLSERAANRFIRYQPNFGTSDLIASELFGHRYGAFTGAVQERRGLIAEANGGTLFLDEIDELPKETQVTLLHTLQEKKFRRIGADQEESADFRLICATNQDTEKCLSEGKLRSDFYHRVAHFKIYLPPLRNRKEDIAELAQHFLVNLQQEEKFNVMDIEPEALAALSNYNWPGNVRELEAVIAAAALRAEVDGRTAISPMDLTISKGRTESVRTFSEQIESYKVSLIQEALRRCNDNQVQAARELGLDRSTLRRILARSQLSD